MGGRDVPTPRPGGRRNGEDASSLLGLLVALLVLSECGSSSNPAGPGGGGGNQGANEVRMSGFASVPASKTVVKGTTVTWTNKDAATHNVHQTSGPVSFQSPELGQGATWSFTFSTSGTYTYRCDFHPSMTGTIIVNP